MVKIAQLRKGLLRCSLCLLVSLTIFYCLFERNSVHSVNIEAPTLPDEEVASALNRLRSGGVPCSQVQNMFFDRIPPVIHWTNRDDQVLAKHCNLVLSWPAHLAESAAYMLWDDAKIEHLLMRHYPELWKRYKHLGAGILRSDLGRLAIVHHVGGVYTDLDVKLLRDFLPLLKNHSSLWSQEPWEHANYLYGRREMLSNALFMSRAKDPFLEYVLRAWPDWFDRTWLRKPGNHLANSLSAVAMTGPVMLNHFMDEYRRIHGNSTPTLAKPDAFQPWWDATSIPLFLRKDCVFTAVMKPKERQRCLETRGAKFVARSIPADSYAIHLYLHTGYGAPLNYSGAKKFKLLLNASSCIV